jgi:ABC-type polysaccharide/polyol phosphate export permease
MRAVAEMDLQSLAKDSATAPSNPAAMPSVADAASGGRFATSAYETISDEILSGFRAWPVWIILGWDDIRQRYRRSVIGPFWITLTMGAFILLLGVIYSRLFHQELRYYLPYLPVGYITWGFMSANITESCYAFLESGRIIKQIKLPYLVYVMRVIWRNFIVFLHTAVIFIPLAVIFKLPLSLTMLYAIPGLLLVCLNQVWLVTLLAIATTRFRDLQPIIVTAVQIMMFATPIMWMVKPSDDTAVIAQINPVSHLISLVREPMLGTAPEGVSWIVALGMLVVGSAAATALLVSKSRRIVFWI